MTINELKNMLTNIGLNVESEKLSKTEVQLFPTEQSLKDNTAVSYTHLTLPTKRIV